MARRLASILLLVGAAACGDPTIVVPEVLGIVTVLPSHGATDIATDVQALVYFSSPLKDTTAAARELTMECLGTPPCSSPVTSGCPADPAVSAAVTFELNQVAHIAPDATLWRNTCYGINVGAGIEAADKDVGPLPLEVHSAFETTP